MTLIVVRATCLLNHWALSFLLLLVKEAMNHDSSGGLLGIS